MAVGSFASQDAPLPPSVIKQITPFFFGGSGENHPRNRSLYRVGPVYSGLTATLTTIPSTTSARVLLGIHYQILPGPLKGPHLAAEKKFATRKGLQIKIKMEKGGK